MTDHHHADDAATDTEVLEAAFIAGFTAADDPQAFLRLAGIPLQRRVAGARLHLVDVRIEHCCSVGSVSPGFASTDLAYQPLPRELTRHTRRVVFVYLGRYGPKELNFADVATAQPAPKARPRHPHHHHGEFV